jgi:hypothetical protein
MAAGAKGRPLLLQEVAALFRAAEGSERRMMLLMIPFGTLCRPDAARDLMPFQHDAEHQLLKLNPQGPPANEKVPANGSRRRISPTVVVATDAFALHRDAARAGCGREEDDPGPTC